MCPAAHGPGKWAVEGLAELRLRPGAQPTGGERGLRPGADNVESGQHCRGSRERAGCGRTGAGGRARGAVCHTLLSDSQNKGWARPCRDAVSKAHGPGQTLWFLLGWAPACHPHDLTLVFTPEKQLMRVREVPAAWHLTPPSSLRRNIPSLGARRGKRSELPCNLQEALELRCWG